MTGYEPPGRPGYGPQGQQGYGPPPGQGGYGPPPGPGGPGQGGQGPPPRQGGYGPPPGQGGYGPPPGPGGYEPPGQGGYGPPPGPGGYGPPPGQGGYGPPPGQGGGAFGPPPGPGFGPTSQFPPGTPPKKNRLPLIITAVVLVGALVAVGIIFVPRLFSGAGGAGSPSAVVSLLAENLQDKDYPQALSRLDPNELKIVSDLGDVFENQLKRLEVIKPDASLDQASTGDLTVTGLTFADGSERVRDGVEVVRLTGGTITVNPGDPNALPLTDKFKQAVFPNGIPNSGRPMTINIADELRKEGMDAFRIATHQVDGEWYVSAFYTLADAALVEENLAWPQDSIAPNGGSSAEDAVRQTVQAVLDQDARRLVELAPPEELAVLHDVGPAIVQAAGRSTPSGAQIVDLQTTSTSARGNTALQLSRLTVAAQGQQVTVSRDGDCLVIDAGGQTQRQCIEDILRQAGGIDMSTSPVLARLAPKLGRAILDVKVVTVEAGGKFYVSPAQTLIQLYDDLLGILEPGDIEELVKAYGN